jgi:hypothetical protein
MADSMAEQGICKMNLEHFIGPESKEVLNHMGTLTARPRMMGYVKETIAERVPSGQRWNILSKISNSGL